jgi:hypothetical protein
MKVSVDDKAGLGGYKHFWVKDHKGNTLYESDAKPAIQPLNVEVDIGYAEYIEINALDYNGQTLIYVRWIDVRFISKN